MADTKISALPPSSTMTPDQALASVSQFEPSDVIIIGYDCRGEFFTRSSRLTKQEALWLTEKLREHVLGS